MNSKRVGRVLLGLMVAASGTAAAACFWALFRLRDDPLPSLAATFQLGAFLQVIPFVAAAILAVFIRRRPEVLGFTLAAVLLCGAFGWWWLSGLAEIRRLENEPIRRRALGNILPDFEGQSGVLAALLWPLVTAAMIGVLTLLGWAIAGFTKHQTAATSQPQEDDHVPSLASR